jgi:hypothetical protein
VRTISDLLEQATLLASSTLLQDDHNLFQTCEQLGTSSANTSCWQLWEFYACTHVKTHKLWQTRSRRLVDKLSTARCQRIVDNLLQTCHNNWEQAVRTHPDISLTTTLFQLVCRSVTTSAFLRVCRVFTLNGQPISRNLRNLFIQTTS